MAICTGPGWLIGAGTSVQTSQPGESGTLAPLEFLRLQYSTDPPSSADPSREPTPEQAAEAAQAAPTSVQVSGRIAWTCTLQHRLDLHSAM